MLSSGRLAHPPTQLVLVMIEPLAHVKVGGGGRGESVRALVATGLLEGLRVPVVCIGVAGGRQTRPSQTQVQLREGLARHTGLRLVPLAQKDSWGRSPQGEAVALAASHVFGQPVTCWEAAMQTSNKTNKAQGRDCIMRGGRGGDLNGASIQPDVFVGQRRDRLFLAPVLFRGNRCG
jgi:hypothetical protein